MKNKRVKQMICTVCQEKMKRADPQNKYVFKFGRNGLGFYINNGNFFISAYPFGVISVKAQSLKGR
ncbi:hypothetical protein PVK64_17050 [Aliivibrio sp. S4TY2]|uniref:hypothetical protein n=1 Tax=unclassified Aliivibrio TaxID=2645654 RepID=UPI0023785B09|nr:MULTISPECIES: hypothetical protein [unclassified Aliivibrio]MDD9157877.1 hypothetical protein [Aliivibrio sp. S4TY2]MDD9161906.1 hypothetical protein [Aliivibrio sp. S4TY1]MDD9165877.1 hypothetical protein [Aliivibrio sp. S4MY2]MDD9169876.1 hypothetical protein [Aliivibrio sp. S4MY4]MDD9185493.1 hypothetical protein [Aliivibrio sp. S4MY3]